MKHMYVGDPHVKPSNIEESSRLMSFILEQAKENNIERIVLLGDLMHTHAIVRLEVLSFWEQWLDRLSDLCEVIVLVGNHDVSGNGSDNYSALTVFNRLGKEKLSIIQSPVTMGVFGYMPYIHDNEKFVAEANRLAEQGAKVLVSHTTYEGSKYDNGMYAPDGVSPDLINPSIDLLISGHVHTEQEYGRVWYPGTARWDTASDANKRKGIWICVHDDAGRLTAREFVSTGEGVCTPIVSIEWKEGEEAPQIPEGKVQIELIGSSDWISKEKANLKGKVSIKTKVTDTKREVRKSGSNLLDFVNNHFESKMKNRLIEYMKELNLV